MWSCFILSYLDPPLDTGVMPSPTDINRIITWNGQFFPLADQGNDGLKMFQNNIPSCNGTSPQEVCSWYISLTQHASTCGFYVHPYFCFRPSIASLVVFTCGFDISPTAAVIGSPYVPATTAILAVAAAHGVAAVPTAPAIDAIASVPASAAT